MPSMYTPVPPPSEGHHNMAVLANRVVLSFEEDSKEPSCPCLSRASTCSLAANENVDPRDKPGGDDKGESPRGWRLSGAVSKREPDSRGTNPAMTDEETGTARFFTESSCPARPLTPCPPHPHPPRLPHPHPPIACGDGSLPLPLRGRGALTAPLPRLEREREGPIAKQWEGEGREGLGG